MSSGHVSLPTLVDFTMVETGSVSRFSRVKKTFHSLHKTNQCKTGKKSNYKLKTRLTTKQQRLFWCHAIFCRYDELVLVIRAFLLDLYMGHGDRGHLSC